MFFKSKFGTTGASPKRVVAASADDISKTLLTGETFLKYPDYHSFWSTLSLERDVCSRYVARIINLLMNFEADPIKMEKLLQKTSVVNMEYLLVSLLNTLHFLDMFVGIDPSNGAFVSSIEKYELKKRNTPRFKIKRVDEALNELSRRRNHRGHVAVKMVVDCTSLESDGELQRAMQKSMSELMFLDESGLENILDSTRSDYPFTFTCLSRISRTESATHVFDEMLRQLNGGTGCTISALPHMQGRTLAIILMLRELLTQNPSNDDAWMQRASGIISSFYKWPKPYGPFARDMIEFIDIERRAPGWHLRERLMDECPQLRPQLIPEIAGDATPSKHSGIGHTFVFVDGSSPASKVYVDLFSMDSLAHDTADPTEDPAAVTGMKRKILTHVVDLDLCIRDSAYDENSDPLGLASKTDGEVNQWYNRAMSVCVRAKSLPCAGDTDQKGSKNANHLPPGGLAKLFREAYLGELVDEIAPDLRYCARRAPLFDKSAIPAASVRRSTTMIPGSPPTPLSGSPILPPFVLSSSPEATKRFQAALERDSDDDTPEAENSAPGDDDGTDLVIPDPVLSFGEYSPALPPVHFSAFEFSADVLLAPSAAKRISVPLDAKELKYQHDHLDVGALNQLIEASKRDSNGSDTVRVKVLLIGGNFVVHKFLCALIYLASKDATLVETVEFDLFVAPCSRNDIATFLARSDKWYRRHVFYPFVGPVGLCPQFDFLRDAESAVGAGKLGLSVPLKCLHSLLEDFVRQANHTVETSIYECLCWTEYAGGRSSRSDGQTEGPTVCIPFVMGLELGVFVQANIYRKQMEQATSDASNRDSLREACSGIPSYDDDEGDLKEIIMSKNFSPTATELSISYAPSTMAGDVGEESVIRSGQYMTLSLSNLPDMYDDFGSPLRKNKTDFEIPVSPDSEALVMNSRSSRNGLKDLLANRKKNMKGKSDWFLDALVESESFDIPVNVSIVDIVAANPLESFHVMIDGRIFGPFKRIVVQPCQVLKRDSSTTLSSKLPIKTFLPVAP